jgi:hypothetical protein
VAFGSTHTKVCPLSCSRLWIGNVLEFLCWKWKPYPRVVFLKSRLVSVVVLYMRSLLLVESFDLHPSNQYILVTFCENVFLPGKSPVKV